MNPQYSPNEHAAVNWTDKGERQYAHQPDNSPCLNKQDKTYVQQVVGGFLCYTRALDSIMLIALSQIGSQQALPTNNAMKKFQRLMNYANTYSNAYV